VRLTDTTTAGWWSAPSAGNASELLRQGKTIPYSWDVEPGVFDVEMDAIFAKTWQYAGHSSRLAETGDFITCMAGRIPVMVTRDAEGDLRGYVNVCPHRGHPVAIGAGRRTTIQCMYHGWTFGLDGALRGEHDTWSDFHLYYIWPNFMLSARGNDHYYTYSYVPTGPERTLQMTEYFVPAEVSETELEGQIEDLRSLMAEDWGVFERVQVGMRSGMLPFGNLLPQEERLLRQFQRLYVDAIAGHAEASA
jgi:nitrite reductase/ring-hydroxylating ferredoxin subunit